jgi:cell division inhibitor SepF
MLRRAGQIIGVFEEDPNQGYYEQDYEFEESLPEDDYGAYDDGRGGYAQPQQPYRQAPQSQGNVRPFSGGRQQAYADDGYGAPPRAQAKPRPQPAQRFAETQAQPAPIFGNQRAKRPAPDNVVSFNRDENTVPRRQHSEIIYCVRRLEDCQEIIQALLDGQSLFLNMEELDDVQYQRVLDMLGGATFALSGTMAKISHRTYLVAPSNVHVVNSYSGGGAAAQPPPRGDFAAFRH